MDAPLIILFAVLLTASSVALGQTEGGKPGAYQVPVVEGVERPDSPAADAAEGDAEAQMPAGVHAPSDVAPPPAENAPDVEQPSAEP